MIYELFTNFMDYTNDEQRVMFTKDQAKAMHYYASCIIKDQIKDIDPCDNDIILSSQEDIDTFEDNYGCTVIEGSLYINGPDINNLDGLSGVTAINGNLNIISNPNLTSIEGLSSIESIGGDIEINYNGSLSDCCLVLSLQEITEGSVDVTANDEGCNDLLEIEETCGEIDTSNCVVVQDLRICADNIDETTTIPVDVDLGDQSILQDLTISHVLSGNIGIFQDVPDAQSVLIIESGYLIIGEAIEDEELISVFNRNWRPCCCKHRQF